MKTIGVHFKDPNREGYPFDDAEYRLSYCHFGEYVAAQGARLVFVRGDSYLGDMQFERAWEFVGDRLEEIEGPVRCDVVYRKSRLHLALEKPSDNFRNSWDFEGLASDKWATFQALSDYTPQTVAVDGSVIEAAAQISTEKVVLKPIKGFGGRGVIVIEKNKLSEDILEPDVLYVAQEFIDSSAGIPGLVDGMHDLRLIFFNGTPRFSFLRMPAPGSFLANIAQGGSVRVVDVAEIPESIREFAQEINGQLSHYGSLLYSVDLFYGNGRPYLIEINSQPCMPIVAVHGEAYERAYMESLFKFLTA